MVLESPETGYNFNVSNSTRALEFHPRPLLNSTSEREHEGYRNRSSGNMTGMKGTVDCSGASLHGNRGEKRPQQPEKSNRFFKGTFYRYIYMDFCAST